ncbi:hypothetical protein WHI96_01600 [Pseudonocardia tropica]|uniref:Glycosyltransferase RgtA/B/C/D-like domain-containing protein n=1 Tax=Pseudonocardia tropica TaxID=681289 RepID=A0ABV1JNI7_9PSEU
MLFQLALVGEAGHSLPPQNPTVAGLPLDYHWFTHAVTAHIAAAAHVDPALATVRFMPTSLVLGTALVVATVARLISGRIWAGPIAAALLLVVGESGGTAWRATVPVLSMVHTNWWASLTQTFGDLVVVGTVGVLAGLLRDGGRAGTVPVVLLVPVLMTGAGVKSTILPVVLCGLLAACAVAVLQRRHRTAVRAGSAAGIVAVVLVGATILLYGGRSYGTVVAPLAGARAFAAALVPGLSGRIEGAPLATGVTLPLATTLALTAFWLAVGTARWLGLAVLVRRRIDDPVTWLVLGTVTAGVIATLTVRHPGGSEAYFLRTVFPVGVTGSAAGLTVLFAARPGARELPGTAAVAMAAAVLTAGALAVLAPWPAGTESPTDQWQREFGHAPARAELGQIPQVWAYVGPVVTVWAAVSTAAVLTGLVVAARRPAATGRAVAVAVLVGGVLGTGVGSTWGWTVGTRERSVAAADAAAGPDAPGAVTGGHVAAAHWVRDHAGPDDVVATNRWCRDDQRTPDGSVRACAATAFWVPAYTERRVLVSGWAYSGPSLDTGARSTSHYTRQPFWDPALLDLQERAFAAPTPAVLGALRERGVRYLVADRRAGPIDLPGLDSLAERRFTDPDAVVWSVR